jgi:ribosomal protein S5
MGNGNGLVGYGKGKGSDFEEALDNALLHCKRNLIAIPLDIYHTVPQKLEG